MRRFGAFFIFPLTNSYISKCREIVFNFINLTPAIFIFSLYDWLIILYPLYTDDLTLQVGE